tara:strand:- start:3106 stop:6360 length:3255 start_codon:yes stop_codon:yes gene_type:complete
MANRSLCDFDVDGELKATSLDINGAADISGNANFQGDLTVAGKITQAGVIDREEWGRTYTVNTNSPLPLLTDGGAALPTGGAYRMTGHISGTGSEQVACAVFWNENGTWYINKTFEGGTSSNQVEFKILNSLPTVTLENHATNYNVHVAHERLSLDEDAGTDNLRGYFGSDSYLSWLETTNTLTVPGDIGVNALTASGKITGAELEGTSLDINGAGDVSGALNVGGSLTATGGGISGNLYANRYFQTATGIPTSNLGAPTVSEMALFEEQFGPKTTLANGYDDLADLKFFTRATGTTEGDYTEVTTYTDDQKRKFLRTNNSPVIIDNTHNSFRVEFVGKGYTFANAMYAYWSSQSHNTQVHVWKKRCSDNAWVQHTSSSTTINSWPGHAYLPFVTIPWYETNTTSATHYSRVRIEFTPNWIAYSGSGTDYSTRDILLYGMQIWGGYPTGRRTPHQYDQNGKLNLFGDIDVPGNMSVDGNVGIGTASPAEKLHVNGGHLEVQNSGNTNIYINAAAGSDSTLWFQEGGGVKGKIQNDASNDSILISDGANADTMTLKGQKVGIGTAAPGEVLDVVGNIAVSGTVDGVDIATRDALLTTTNNWGDHGAAGYATTSYADTAETDAIATAATASEAYTDAAIVTLVDSAPGALNTLNELATALGDDVNFSTTVTDSIATKLPLAGGTMTGTLATGTNAFGGSYLSVSAGGVTQWGASRGIMTWDTGYASIYGNGTNVLKLGGHGDTGRIVIGDNVIDITSPTNFGVDDTGHDVKFFGATLGAYMLWDESEDGVIIKHPTGDAGLEVYTISSGTPTSPQFKVGRDAAQYWGVYTDDRSARLVHRQDETDAGAMYTSSELWGSGTGNDSWTWKHGTSTGTSLATVMTLDKAGQLTITGEIEGGSLDINGAADISGSLTLGTALAATEGGTGLASISTLLNSNVTSVSGNAGTVTNGVYTTGDQSISGKKSFAGPTQIEQTWIYDMSAGSLDTTGYACAGLSSSTNGASATFVFECGGSTGNSYQRIVYNCWNVSGTWNTSKNVDEGGNKLDVTASANGATITFTFKSRSGSQSYTPRVHVQATGTAVVTTY